MDAEEAYAECERITWEQARNFAYGIRLLPTPKRRALAAVYAYARRIDDIGDGDLPAEAKAAALEAEKPRVAALAAGELAGSSDAVLVALTDAGQRFGELPLIAFQELIDGCLADVNEARYETWDDLYYYCRCVAGSIGRLSLGVYGATEPDRQAVLADDLGIALQITNILRNRSRTLPGRPASPASSSSRPTAPASGTAPACGCWPPSTGAAPPAPARWPASTAACWRGWPPPRALCWTAACRCRARRRPSSPSAP